MRRCGARPYKGKEKYIFISYSHKDRPRVFPIIERLARDGYRVWYDEGIDPGSEWPTIIAEHLLNCEVCIPLISKNFLESSNCHQEITYALSKKKKVMTVLLEDVTLPAGLEMQLSVIHKVYKHNLTDEEFFYNLYDGENLKPCQGKPNPAIRVSVPEDYVEKKTKAPSGKPGENPYVSRNKAVQNADRTTGLNGKEQKNEDLAKDPGGRETNSNERSTENAGRASADEVNWEESGNMGRIAGTEQENPQNPGRPAESGQINQENAGRPAGSEQENPQNPGATAEQNKDKKLRRSKKTQKNSEPLSNETKKPAAEEGSKEPVAKEWRKYLPPGYRSGKTWHMVVATCYYGVVIASFATAMGSDLLENIVSMAFCIVVFFGSAAIWGNYLDCWQKIPFMKNKYFRILGFVLYPALLTLIMIVLTVIILVYAVGY